MSHPMICPVCDTDFTTQIMCMSYVDGTVDSCGSANENLTIHGKCPECNFNVVAEFHYDERSSNEQMEWANEDTHRQTYVSTTTLIERWMTNEDADTNEGEEE